MGGGEDVNIDVINKSNKDDFGSLFKMSVHESDQFLYFLEFAHLADYGREMWCKRRREDILFSSNYSREDQTFEKSCFKFVMDNFKQ